MPFRRALAIFATTTAASVFGGVAHADVSAPHPGLTLVRESGHALLVVDLCAPGVSIRATTHDERKKTAATWGQDVGAQAALNADFFDNPAVTYVIGRARGNGEDWPANAQNKEDRQYWQFGPGEASVVLDNAIEPPTAPAITEVIGGHNAILVEGVKNVSEKPLLANAYRRTAFGISEDRRTLYLYASDTSRTASQIVDAMIDLGGQTPAPPIWWITNQDGGGSSQMWVDGVGQVVSSSRLVANHIGVYATGDGAPTNCVQRYAGTPVGRSFPEADDVLEVALGESVEGYLELENTGTVTWTPGKTKLAPLPRDEPSPIADTSWENDHRAAVVDADTPKGETGRFTFRIRGNALGDATYAFGLVEEGVTWFADAGGPADDAMRIRVRVVAPQGATGASTGGASSTGSGSSLGGSGGAFADGDGDGDDGCGCRVGGPSGPSTGALLVALGGLVMAVRRRRTVR